MNADLIVIGGGLMGLAVAVEAADAGMRVMLLEADRIGRHASSASAGGVRSLNRHPAEIPLARAALPLWHELPARLGHDVGFAASGQIRVAEDAAAMTTLEARAALVRELGYDHEELMGAEELRVLEPQVAPHCLGALIVRDDGFADPLKAVRAWRAAAVTRGVEIREATQVRALGRAGDAIVVETPAGEVRARAAVNAAGAWSAEIAEAVGDRVEMEPRALQMSVTTPVPRFVNAVIGTQGRKLSLKQMPNGSVVIGGGYEGPIDAEARVGRALQRNVAANVTTAVGLFPRLRAARIARSWAGIEGWTGDGLPVLGPSRRVPRLVHAFGFSAHGFALVPLVGRLVTAMIEGRTQNLPLEPFRPGRFAQVEEGQDA
jgi:sarcosine oxidase subunit beta